MKPEYPPLERINRHKGQDVNFTSPVDGTPYTGKVLDFIELDPVGGEEGGEWGWYRYFSELIEWPDGTRSIRLSYWHYHSSAKQWQWNFGGQYSIEDEPSVVNKLLELTLAKNWS